MPYMTTRHKNILSEILLEITLVIANQNTYDKIVKKTLAAWLRRLNCTVGALISNEHGKIIVQNVIPTFLRSKFSEHHPLINAIKDKKIEVFESYKFEGQNAYVFHLGQERYFIFLRKNELSEEQCNEIFPVTQFFGKSLDNAFEREKRIKVERELSKERRLLRTVLDSLPEAIYLKDTSLKKILSNHADIKNIGAATEEEVLNKTDLEVFPKDIAQAFIEDDQYVLKTGQPILNKTEQIVNNEGRNEWLSTSKYPLKDDDGTIIGIVGTGRNITDQLEAEEQIKRLSLVASQTTNGVIITDVRGYVEWINDGFTRLTEYTFEEMVGKKPGEILQGPQSDEDVTKRMGIAIKNGKSFEEEIINYKKDGTPYFIKISCNPLRDEEGNINGFMAIESDITEKVENEKALIEAKQIAEKAKDAEKLFLANMSHEIRTPLNAIIGMTSLLKDTKLDAEQTDYTINLEQSSKFLLSLITDILDLAKVESGKVEPKFEPFDLDILLQNLYSTFLLKANGKPVKVILEKSDELPSIIKGDELLIQQILNNLLSNAEKFTPEGSITLNVHTYEEDGQSWLKCAVIDTGIGISDEDQSKLFQKFNQFGTDENNKKGSGLGLCITKELIEVMEGTISVKSTINKGSTFSFVLPIEIIEAKNTSDQRVFKKINQGVKYSIDHILIAEDNLMNQKYISRLLQKLNIKFTIANNGKEVVALAKEKEYSLILMDLQMPEMDGYEATIEIRNSKNPNKYTPIIALTASALVEQRKRAFEVGMSDFLSKPFTPDQLKEKFSLM